MILTYAIIAVILLAAELIYFRIADKCNIIDKPNERSSHSTIVLRGGGVIFAISMIVWQIWLMVQGEWCMVGKYLPFMVGLILIAGVSFWDDVKSLPDRVRLVAQFLAMGLAAWSMIQGSDLMALEWYWLVLIGIAALIVFVGATNIINFMDGINGITAGYALAVLEPLLMLDVRGQMEDVTGFIEPSYLIVAIIGVLVFCIFNFRPKGKAKCFAGDVGSIGIAFIMLFAIGKLIVQTGDVTYLILLLVYGVDGCLTIIHRIMLHENLGEAHRKHAFQLMANELKIGHVKVTLLYMAMQLAVSLGFIYLIPNTVAAHWGYFVGAILVLAVAYVLFKKKYYYLHEEYLRSLRSN
ncbi:glycosyltransferase family 4 protein [Prevotella communis]|uniref:MraY family glycosyltransferase n=1 Tax=Prevotella communis TaxID=2913614 RepID=UPI001EDBB5C9|nr:glycosyltransferase family 4 protein [Prevotella communis]UKK59586.1 glycosyltransferase family 4 protein [Prevotella communis]